MPQVDDSRSYSEMTAREIDEAVRGLVDHSLDKATDNLRKNTAQLHETAETLLEEETLTADELPDQTSLAR